MKPWTLFGVNLIIAVVCLGGLYIYGNTPPVNYVLMAGVAWILISSLAQLGDLRKKANR